MSTYSYHDHLETARLRTRFLTHDDLDVWTPFFESSIAIEFFPAYASKPARESAQEWLNVIIQRYKDQRYGLQAVIEKSSGQFIGQCGLLAQRIDNIDELEVGYSLLPQYWGKGYAIEIAKSFRDYGFKSQQVASIISIIHIDNIRSQTVAQRNGMTREKQVDWRDMPVYVYRITREEWLRRK